MDKHIATLEAMIAEGSVYAGSPVESALRAAIALMRAPVGDGRTYAETCAYSRGYHAGKKAAMQEAGK